MSSKNTCWCIPSSQRMRSGWPASNSITQPSPVRIDVWYGSLTCIFGDIDSTKVWTAVRRILINSIAYLWSRRHIAHRAVSCCSGDKVSMIAMIRNCRIRLLIESTYFCIPIQTPTGLRRVMYMTANFRMIGVPRFFALMPFVCLVSDPGPVLDHIWFPEP